MSHWVALTNSFLSSALAHLVSARMLCYKRGNRGKENMNALPKVFQQEGNQSSSFTADTFEAKFLLHIRFSGYAECLSAGKTAGNQREGAHGGEPAGLSE